MTAIVIPLRPDRYVPLKFETPPETAAELRQEYDHATIVLQFAQTVRNEIFQSGEPLSKPKRDALMAMQFIIDDLRS